MFQIFKIFLLILLLNTFSFAVTYTYYELEPNHKIVKYDYSGDLNSYIRVGNDIFKSTVIDKVEFLNSKDYYHKNAFYKIENDYKIKKALIFLDVEVQKLGCWTLYPPLPSSQLSAECNKIQYDSDVIPFKIHLNSFKFVELEKITTCQPDEHFNTKTKQCQKCNKGQSWDSENNRCYDDCTDVNKNIFGFKNGKCLDCSGEKRDVDVAQCICKYHGSEYDNTGFTGTPTPNGGNASYTWWSGTCKNGMKYKFKSPEAPNTPKPDNNDTNPKDPKDPKDPKNPNGPGGGNNGGNNGPGGGNGNGKDNDNPNNPGPGGPNPDGPGDKDNEFCKKNPKDPKCKNKDNNNTKPKGPGGPGGGGPSGDDGKKDGDAKFNPDDFKYGDIEDMYKDLKGKLQNSVKENEGKFKDLEKGINQLIDNIKGNGLTSFDKQSAPTSCKRSFVVPIYGKSVSFDVDLCKLLEPMRPVVYYVVYVSAFAGGLFLVIKLIIFSF